MNLREIKKTSWYRQETAGTPYFIYGPCCGCLYSFKRREGIIWVCMADRAYAYLGKDVLQAEAEKSLNKEKNESGSHELLFKKWIKEVKDRNEPIFQEIEKSDISKISDAKLLALNKKLAAQNFKMWTGYYMDVFDADAEGLIEWELVNAGINLTGDERNVLMSQNKLLMHQREEKDLLKIVQQIKNVPGVSNAFQYITAPGNLHRLKLYPEIQKELDRHQNKYFWMNNSWAATKILDVFDFVENIKQILAGPRDIDKELEKLKKYEGDILKQKKEIAERRHFSPWLRQMFDFFALLSYWRDERKTQMQRLNHYLEIVGKEIGRRSGLDWNEIGLCDPLAVKSIPVSKKLVEKYRKLFRNNYTMLWDGHKVEHLDKAASKKVMALAEETIKAEMTEIRGMIACPGKVEGEVVVITNEKEFAKMKKGMILVTPMTRPEFVPLMRMAAAIVTDEGGITSHAAVVSREMKVPCVIGTQVATKVLKDGDKVLVNADHGVVIVRE